MALDDFPTEAELAADQAAPGLARSLAPEAPESEDLFDFPTIVAFAEDAAQGATPARARLLAEEALEEELSAEQDLFDAPELEGSIDAATRSVTQLLAQVPEPEQRTSQSARTTKARTSSADVVEIDRRARRGAGGAHPATLATPVLVTGPSRPIWILVAAAMLLNLGFFAFLWQTSQAFQETLAEVRAERTQSVFVPSATAGPESLRADRGLDPADRRLQPPMGIEPPEEVALRLAREELAGARPAEARRRLFALLATVDGLERTRRDHVEARAAFLVAETFRAQALATQGERP